MSGDSTSGNPSGGSDAAAAATAKKQKNRKPKPWDDGTIDHWKIEPVSKDEPLPPPLEV